MSKLVLWSSPRIPDELASDDDMLREVRANVDELSAEDYPSSSDTAMIFQ